MARFGLRVQSLPEMKSYTRDPKPKPQHARRNLNPKPYIVERIFLNGSGLSVGGGGSTSG